RRFRRSCRGLIRVESLQLGESVQHLPPHDSADVERKRRSVLQVGLDNLFCLLQCQRLSLRDVALRTALRGRRGQSQRVAKAWHSRQKSSDSELNSLDRNLSSASETGGSSSSWRSGMVSICCRLSTSSRAKANERCSGRTKLIKAHASGARQSMSVAIQ